MSKYTPLTRWLEEQADPDVTISMPELEALLGFELPPSSALRNWWGNGTKGQAASWSSAGRFVSDVDLTAGLVTFSIGMWKTKSGGAPVVMDGKQPLLDLLAASGNDLLSYVARHCVFLHPETVAATECRAVFPTVRARKGVLPGTFDVDEDGTPVMRDDNASPTLAFNWAANRKTGPETQYNHVWTCSQDRHAYTALWNLCCTPAFLAKLTDKDAEVKEMIKHHSWHTFGQLPKGEPEPEKPTGYEDLVWATPPEPLDELAATMRERLASNPSQRVWSATEKLGWLFS